MLFYYSVQFLHLPVHPLIPLLKSILFYSWYCARCTNTRYYARCNHRTESKLQALSYQSKYTPFPRLSEDFSIPVGPQNGHSHRTGYVQASVWGLHSPSEPNSSVSRNRNIYLLRTCPGGSEAGGLETGDLDHGSLHRCLSLLPWELLTAIQTGSPLPCAAPAVLSSSGTSLSLRPASVPPHPWSLLCS